MYAIESAFNNNAVAIPWMLGPEDNDLDLEIHGCGCGCDGGCGCGCGCSCSCSCSCDDTGANDDSAPDDNSSDDGNSANLGFDESASDSAKECVADMGKGVAEDTFETIVATIVGGYVGGLPVAAGAAAVSIVDDAADAAKKSNACQATVEAAANNETFVQATHTYFAVGN